jgi:hypothetical protein
MMTWTTRIPHGLLQRGPSYVRVGYDVHTMRTVLVSRTWLSSGWTSCIVWGTIPSNPVTARCDFDDLTDRDRRLPGSEWSASSIANRRQQISAPSDSASPYALAPAPPSQLALWSQTQSTMKIVAPRLARARCAGPSSSATCQLIPADSAQAGSPFW